jgi:hypothetical protein
LSWEFKLQDLGATHYFIGIELVTPTSMGLMLRQYKYTLDILHKTCMSSCKPVDTLVSPSKLNMMTDNLFSDSTRFLTNYWCLSIPNFTRPNICYAINKVC